MQQGQQVLAAWRTTHRATTYLIENLPAGIWSSAVPGVPGRTVRMIAAHIHNARCGWIRTIGAGHGITRPRLVDPRRVGRAELLQALSRSSAGMLRLFELAIGHEGKLPRVPWLNFPPDLEHFLSYFAAHEAHHRGQLCLVARQLGQRLPGKVADGVWQWTRMARESSGV